MFFFRGEGNYSNENWLLVFKSTLQALIFNNKDKEVLHAEFHSTPSTWCIFYEVDGSVWWKAVQTIFRVTFALCFWPNCCPCIFIPILIGYFSSSIWYIDNGKRIPKNILIHRYPIRLVLLFRCYEFECSMGLKTNVQYSPQTSSRFSSSLVLDLVKLKFFIFLSFSFWSMCGCYKAKGKSCPFCDKFL